MTSFEIQKAVLVPLGDYQLHHGGKAFDGSKIPTEEVWQVCGRYGDAEGQCQRDLEYLRKNNPSKTYRLIEVKEA